MASSQDAWYLSLLGLAENFRTSSPPNIKSCIQCLQAVFNFKPPPRVEARTHLQLGNILLTHTKNIDLARSHLEQAWMLSQNINAFDDVKFEAASVVAELYDQQQQSSLSKPILRKAIELSQHNVYWHCRLIFQLAQIHASEKDLGVAGSLLGVGADYSYISNASYTRVLFLLSKAMVLLIDKKFTEVPAVLNQAGPLIETWQASPHQKEYLKVYFLVLQVCHCLMSGQVKSVKPCLKQLQQSIQTIMSPSWPSDEVVTGSNIGDMFVWMPKEHLYVLVYLVTVMHSMQAGYMDKAQKYTDKALTQIEKLKIVDNKPILSVFQLMLLEHIVMCRLVMGNKSLALAEISQACQLCRRQPRLLQSHKPQLHALLGLYAMSMNCMEAAEAQFTAALRTSQERELWTFANLNLAIVYLRTKRDAELGALLERINPESLPSHSHSLRAAAYYVQGLQAFFGARYNEAKRYLRETLKMANSEDLNRLTSCSLVLLGHIFLSLGNSRESMNMVTPAMQLASKIPDVHVQLWASAILKDLYRICGDPNRESEAYQTHCNFSQMLLKDHFQSTQMGEHTLIQWTEGPIPPLPSNPPPSTSQGVL
ncbi:MAU2 chromatid cohesion factor homolog [Neodiprion pinetum]|uniref:MAU2 chromatid cohesion factor homolog n=1 Tax=Neodiprion lecontei TaxID=441921 RepID=A0A6J0CCK4_NEOLC|nr:MAU2 chromatid cohesion factor homolog [Neodiprion lecontei]XP_046427217.1 MAU2 chromatid cohesion factor homolog [Neodiprion fabricii]XP_046483549.1 MAU2 chromatid cohesion factor homolog [Neodiprion pinetum]XP_046621549.1 MAU2 chromatid cohesion factor homolog [Neodiprion virginianus]